MNAKRKPPHPIAKFVAWIFAAGLMAAGFIFSVAVIAVLATLGAIGFAYLWWTTRHQRRALRQNQAQRRERQSTVIEGEARVVTDGC